MNELIEWPCLRIKRVFFVHESNLPSTTRQFNTKLNVSTPYRYQTNSKREKYTKNRDTVQHDVSNKQINICTE